MDQPTKPTKPTKPIPIPGVLPLGYSPPQQQPNNRVFEPSLFQGRTPVGRPNTQREAEERARRTAEREREMAAKNPIQAKKEANTNKRVEEAAAAFAKKSNLNARYPASYKLADTLVQIPLTYLPKPSFFFRTVPPITQTYKTIMSSLRDILTKELQKKNITNSDAMIRNVNSICFQEFLKLALTQIKSGPAPEFSTDPSVTDSKLLNIATAMIVGVVPHLRDNIQFIGSTPVGFKESYDQTRYPKCDQELKKNKAGISPRIENINKRLQENIARYFEIKELIEGIQKKVKGLPLPSEQLTPLINELTEVIDKIEFISDPQKVVSESVPPSSGPAFNAAAAEKEEAAKYYQGGKRRTVRRKIARTRKGHASRRRRRTHRLLRSSRL